MVMASLMTFLHGLDCHPSQRANDVGTSTQMSTTPMESFQTSTMKGMDSPSPEACPWTHSLGKSTREIGQHGTSAMLSPDSP